jgi:hypothetical protein
MMQSKIITIDSIATVMESNASILLTIKKSIQENIKNRHHMGKINFFIALLAGTA